MSKMKLFKLYTHQKAYNDADLLINSKEHPDVNLGDIVEVFHRDDEENTRLLLQITSFNDLKNRDAISIESGVATQFRLRPFTDVVMRVVDIAEVALDSIEITFKDQYMGRSEMWRLKKYLANSCVYVNKKIDYNDMQIRCQVYEMWSQGERVSCGVITDDTKIIFRSSTSMVYLFIQMSSEMWDFDIHGDLYFEKSVNGFLTELFHKWKRFGCNHEVTIVLFSRTFYSAKRLDEFPLQMRDCLQMDYKGRFYEDFYRVVIQNERNDDWCMVLGQLRKHFTTYQETVLNYHYRNDSSAPMAYNATAAQGNFLEVLNISLNTFEKHYLDRTFDRTGQLSVVITPGVGVFEVDRELTNITKQRIIDNGVGSDLVCVGEQPLHAVPLLKFHNKDTSLTSADDYSLPHWINLSFYSTNKKIAYSNFIPRIKIPPAIVSPEFTLNQKKVFSSVESNFLSCNQSEYIHNSLFDYEAFDDQIFQPPPAQSTCSVQRVVRAKKTSVPCLESYILYQNEWENISNKLPNLRRKMSDPDIYHGSSGIIATVDMNLSESLASDNNARHSIVSIAPIVRPGRALINPFDPSHVTIKLTSNRRRWTHIFPKGPTGVLIQQHHYQAVPAKPSANPVYYTNENDCNVMDCYDHASNCSTLSKSISSSMDGCGHLDNSKRNQNYMNVVSGFTQSKTSASNTVPTKTFLWGATGEQEWTPAITTDGWNVCPCKHLKTIIESESTNPDNTYASEDADESKGRIIIGVDWKSLTIPACLPITTDYFPDKRSLHNDYVLSDYTLLPDDVNLDYANNRAVYRKPLSTEEVFTEIVSQRLAQGFQLINFEDKSNGSPAQSQPLNIGVDFNRSISSVLNMKILQSDVVSKEYILSIGRIFHKISLNGSVITVTGYRPRHPYPPINVDYRYRFHAPQHDTYEISGVNFTTEKLENFNWNYMDHYICTRGDTDYPLMESLKYWRYRMYLLPKDNKAMNTIVDGGCQYCDIFQELSVDNANNRQQIDDFMRFMELHINKLKRRKPRDSPIAQSHLTRRRHSTSIISRPPPNQALTNSPFRERVGSNRLPEKRPSLTTRSTASKLERTRIQPNLNSTTNAVSTTSNEFTNRDDYDDGNIDVKLKPNATLREIFESMKHSITGVGFICQTQSLPSFTFVSYDALMWLKVHLSDNRHPLQLLEAMRLEKMICHASGDWHKPIIPGFYLYYIAQQDKSSKDYTEPLNDLRAFENEWMEIEVLSCDYLWFKDGSDNIEISVPNFLRNEPAPQLWTENCKNEKVYRNSHLEIDVNQKSERMEWGHVKYHTVMQPGYAFEIVVEWITSSGPIVWDLINGWIRKANQCNYQLVPVPADPMAEPFTEKSDPLRGPIFIELDTNFLKNNGSIFNEFSEETRSDRMLLFQEAILARFGFLPCVIQKKQFMKDVPKEYQFVHCSGNIFALIRCSKHSASSSLDSSPSRQEGNVTRCVYGHTNNTNIPKKVGFLWAWNHMIPNKKWKSLIVQNSVDGEIFQLKMLKDFREFCANSENRLLKFWQQAREMKMKWTEEHQQIINEFHNNIDINMASNVGKTSTKS